MARHSANNAVLHVFVFAPYCARLGRALSCICVQVTVQTMFCALVHPDIGSCPLTLDPDRLSAEWNSKKMSLSTCAGFCHSFLRYGCWRFIVFANIFEQSTFFPSDAIVERAMTLNNLFCSKMNPFVETGKALWLQTMSEKLPPASFVDTGSPRKFAACTIEGKRRESTMISAMNNVLRCAGQGDLVTRHNRGTGARDLLYCGPIARLTLWVGGGS